MHQALRDRRARTSLKPPSTLSRSSSVNASLRSARNSARRWARAEVVMVGCYDVVAWRGRGDSIVAMAMASWLWRDGLCFSLTIVRRCSVWKTKKK